MAKPTQMELAYMAGIVDGEGHIGWGKHWQVLANGARKCYRYPHFELAMTTHGAIDLIHQFFGGAIHYRDNYKRKRKPTWRLAIVSRQALAFLRAVQPYIVEKGEQVAAVINFYEEMDNGCSATDAFEATVPVGFCRRSSGL